jgi:hypothetical protein
MHEPADRGSGAEVVEGDRRRVQRERHIALTVGNRRALTDAEWIEAGRFRGGRRGAGAKQQQEDDQAWSCESDHGAANPDRHAK